VTSPGHRFGAQDGGSPCSRDLDQFFETFGELRSGQVIGVTAKGRIAPARVDRVLARVPPAAELGKVRVSDSGILQSLLESVSLELRAVARLGNRTHVGDLFDSMSLQQSDEFLDGMRGVSDGEKGESRHRFMLSLLE
jgi:hypothetical protein